MATVALLGTCDTKLEELLFLRETIQLSDPQVKVTLIDVGRHDTPHAAIDFEKREVVQKYGEGQDIEELPRGEVIKTMAGYATKLVKELYDAGSIHGIISAGGSGGTSLAAEVMRNAVPFGFPKLIVSTIASGDTGPIVEETDITLMYSVVDIAGLNQVLRNVLSNAGAAIAGMARSYVARSSGSVSSSRKRIGITMFGVTTPAVDTIRKHLESNYDVETYVFHATGHGGKAMERLVREGGLDAVLDLTTTEVCDLVTGGVMSAGEHRLEAAAKAGIPNIVSVGATDMTNFGPKNTVPERYKSRKLYEHNPVVTLMRTSEEEATEVGHFIGSQLRQHALDPTSIEVWLPRGGISMISTPEGPFADALVDEALFNAVKQSLDGSGIQVKEDVRDINDTSFAHEIAEALMDKIQEHYSIKSAAKTIAGGIVAKYNKDLKDELIPGLFNDPYYWWESGAVLGSLIDYSYLTGDNQYDDLIAEGVMHQVSDSYSFMPPNQTKTLGNEDQSIWGLTAMAAAEDGFSTSKLGNHSWVDFAINVFNDQVQRWNTETCDGGLKWQIYAFNSGYTYKNSFTNGNFFLLAARLAKFTGNSTYSEWAETAFQWTKNIGLIDDKFHVYDGTDESTNCSQINRIQWSYGLGIFTEGAAVMYNVTNGNDTWKEAVTGFVNDTTIFQKDSSVLVEVACEGNGKCNTDQRAFKGIATRSFARAAQAAPFVSGSLIPILQASAQGAADSCEGEKDSLKCALKWTGNGDPVGVDGGLGEAFSALSVVQALLVSDAKAPTTESSGNGTSSENSAAGSPTATGSGKPAENTGGADALIASRNLVIAFAMLAVFFL
ncbi:hypothetical protein N0V90_003589 [Kalmusia sp. IMI 367209]|nr:hypothetical protein N0V90_003589 [Kalmusia sp. IMI 367209]